MDILVTQEAKRLKATVSPSEIDQELTKMMKMRHFDQKQFETQLAKQNYLLKQFARTSKNLSFAKNYGHGGHAEGRGYTR